MLDLEQVAFDLVGHRRQAEVPDHMRTGLADELQGAGAIVGGAVAGQFVSEALQAACARTQAMNLLPTPQSPVMGTFRCPWEGLAPWPFGLAKTHDTRCTGGRMWYRTNTAST